MRFVRLSLAMALILCALGSSRAQEEYSKYLFNIRLRGGFLQVVVSKATATDSDEATNFSSAVASDTTLGLRDNFTSRRAKTTDAIEPPHRISSG